MFAAVEFTHDLLPFLSGGALLLVGQWATHIYTIRRERRAEVTDALDRMVAAFVAEDRALSRLLLAITQAAGAEAIQEAADRVEDIEVQLRAARTQMRLRLGDRHAIVRKFEAAETEFIAVYLALEPALSGQNPAAGVEASVDQFKTARLALEEALKAAEGAARGGLFRR